MEITFLGDFLRPRPLYSNVSHDVDIFWLYNLFYPALSVFEHSLTLEVINKHEIDEVYYELGGEFTHQWYPKIHSNEALTCIKLKNILTKLSDKFIIGFELPPIICSILSGLGCTYINFVIHPIRFMSDLSLAVANCNFDWESKVIKFVLREEYILREYHWFLAKICRQPVPNILKNKDTKKIIFVDQKPMDAALVQDSRYISPIKEFLKLMETSSPSNTYIYKLHPYLNQQQQKTVADELLGEKNVFTTEHNIYELMYHAEKSTIVTAFNSSVLVEAEYFQLPTQCLAKSMFTKNKTIPVGKHPLLPEFWGDILDRKYNPAEGQFTVLPNLRETLGLSWGWK